MRRVILFFAILFVVFSCKKDVIEDDGCKYVELPILIIYIKSFKDNFENVRLENGELDTSKLYVFFFDNQKKKIVETRAEFKDGYTDAWEKYHSLELRIVNEEDLKRMCSLKREKIYIQDVCGIYTYEVQAVKSEDCKIEIPADNIWLNGEKVYHGIGSSIRITRIGE